MPSPDPLPLGEAARRLGISRDGVRKRVSRGLLLATRDNAGRLLVYLPDKPDGQAGQVSATADGSPGWTSADGPGLPSALAERLGRAEASAEALREQVGTLKAQLAKAEEECARERGERREERNLLLGEARAERGALYDRIAGLDERIAGLADRLARAEAEHRAEAAELRKHIAELERPWWRRLLGRREG